MEILSQSTHWGGYLFFMAVVVVMALILTLVVIGGIVSAIKDGCEASDVVAIVFIALFAAVVITALVLGFKDGPTTTYKATVTDYNVLYEAGYEITSTDGKIVTLTKE